MKTATAENIILEEKKETGVTEVCFGAIMAISALAGIWAAVSMLISYFIGG